MNETTQLILKMVLIAGAILGFGYIAMYSGKILIKLAESRDFTAKWYFKLFGRRLKRMQVQLNRNADLNSGTFIFKLYYFFDDLIINLDMKKDNVTVAGLITFIASIALALSIALGFLMSALYLIPVLFGAFTYLLVVLFRFGALMQYEKREAEIMDAVDLLVSDVRDGVYNAIVRYKDSFHANIKPHFLSFIDDIQNKGYDFKQAMLILNNKLGRTFTDFAQKAILYEEKADNTMEDIFSSIIEINRQRRTLRYVNNIKFTELRNQFVISFVLIIGYGIFSAVLDPFIMQFLLHNTIGKILLIVDVLLVAFVLSYMASIKAKSL